MKRVKINAYQTGLVFRNGVYQRLITEGSYWLWNETVTIYNRQGVFNPPIALNLLLQDDELAAMLEVFTVKDQELVLQFENGLLKAALKAGEYAFWKTIAINYSFLKVNTAVLDIPADIDRSLLQHALVQPFVRTVTIENFEKAVLFVDGQYNSRLDSGVYYWWKNAVPVFIARVDSRQQQLEINGQEILTKDKAALRINAWAQFRVADIEKAILQNKDYDKQLYVALQLALREYISGYGLDELLEKKEAIGAFVMSAVTQQAFALGVEVLNFGIRDIILPGDVKEIMNQVLVAEKKAQANTITRREETASTRSLLNTAKLMEENAVLWKLKELEYVEKIADKISNISVNGNGALLEQLKQIFVAPK
ncbi:slipin family protein [Niabella yanshanensis]|uniref:Slipin family protein n=1 Tax=Niabella yanshanensis TaxID=577386 RepID=A0ABZ0W6N7_9BACT|nr:slipin family protein [Niabella yanshanensis]WQD37785.1 slipin family protein [Niabella yanshanensis]